MPELAGLDCEEWLADNYKNEFHVVDEFRGAPNRVNSVLREQGSPLRIGGEPMVVQSHEPEKKKKPEDTDQKKTNDKKKCSVYPTEAATA